ncbi:SIR2 family protein [Arthrobacter sp. YAF34]|uniref:SIR2 family protein n=1 Tax=Arthrobacter sp. YAF34 TaxID=3233083 RepID=UPI003F9218BB
MTDSHLFVTMGNILRFRCDAWLAPTDEELNFHDGWTDGVKELAEAAFASAGPSFRQGKAFAVAAEDWPRDEPLPVFTSVPFRGVESANDLGPRIAAFLHEAARAVLLSPRAGTVQSRRVPLLALPFFGTAAGGGDLQRGEIMRTILRTIVRELPRLECDVVLILKDEAAFALAQDIRRANEDTYWSRLCQEHLAQAKNLALKARRGRLVPFMGSGVSVTAGAPSWEGLLDKLAESVGLDGGLAMPFRKLSPLDQANILQSLHESRQRTADEERGSFGSLVASFVRVEKYGLAPTLLANLPSDGAITLNYDSLFETASADASRNRAIIPQDSTTANVDTGSRWLLKLHGSVSQPDSIVLTRDDYLGYNTNREALSALVKAHLMTHHLLFVGFGLKDDHFHEIVHDVRRAMPNDAGGSGSLGTVLTLNTDPLQELAWKDKLSFISMEDPSSSDSARTLEIFLDALTCYSTESHFYFLAPKYEGGLNAKEKQLRREILKLKTLPAAVGESSVVGVIDEMLRTLGWSENASYEGEL